MEPWNAALIGLAVGFTLGGGLLAAILIYHRQKLLGVVAAAEGRLEKVEEDRNNLRFDLQQTRKDADAHDDQREQAEKQVATLTEQLKASEQARVEHRQTLDELFTKRSSETLRAMIDDYLKVAHQQQQKFMAAASGDVEKKQQAIDNMVKPIRELLDKQNAALGQLEKKREVDQTKIEQQIRSIVASNEKLGTETHRLVTALRRPEQRGRWGEMQLRNAVELAGMTARCDFHEQPQTDDPNTRDRPDMVVNMPGGGVIVVDSKVAIDAYLDGLQPDADRAACMARHAQQVEQHVKRLANKRYWAQFDRTPQLVVLFMPLESALAAALEIKPDLHADAMQQHVLIATPTLLVATLRAVAYGWQQEDVAANAREIAACGKALYERLSKFTEHFEKVGKALDRSTLAYNSAIGSLERQLLPGARKLRELHATTAPEIEAPNPVDTEVREITAAELLVEPKLPQLTPEPMDVGEMSEALLDLSPPSTPG